MEHLFECDVWLPQPRALVFPFFADAHNLQAITPPWLRLEVLTPGPVVMRAGARIAYRLRVHGIPLRWESEITLWDPPNRFRDEQRRGPYRAWIHTHSFEERDGGTLCRDEVRYAVPGGRLVNWLVVRRDVSAIFAYRRSVLLRRFPACSTPAGREEPSKGL